MKIIDRVKNILLTPKKEWVAIESESYPWVKLLTLYLIPLALIPAIGSFIGYGLIGHSVLGFHIGGTLSWGIRQAAISFCSSVGGVLITAFILNLLAEQFGAKKNFDRAFALVAYSYTPVYVAGILYILPSLSVIAMLAGLYGLYILYTGLQPVMKTPPEKVTVYFIVGLVCVIVVSVVLAALLGAILTAGYSSIHI